MKRIVDKNRVLLYVKMGAAYLAFWLIIVFARQEDHLFARVINNIWFVAYLTFLCYVLFEFVVPFIKLKVLHLLAGIFLLWGMLMLYSFGLYAWRSFGMAIGIYTEFIKHETTMKGIEYIMPYSFLSVFFIGIIRYTHDFRQLKADAQKWRIEKQEAELNYLKSQTNPHFLFNTLNNIYSLARDKSDLAPESILRLSKMLRFMLYESNGDYIPIEQELKIIDDYIALEKLRYDESLRLNYHYDIADKKQVLPPLLLIPLVENAFKHGVSEMRGDAFVDISLILKERKLSFTVRNSSDNSWDRPIKENIGLSNLRRQLELLYKEYKLTAAQEGNEFIAHLQINLASHV
jgi:two-component system, LytTR family, sensor kinase